MSKKIKAKSNNSAKSGKVNQFKVSPLIVVIAIVEVILLIGAVSYAWFVIADNNQIDSGVITVAPDSGLRIDFKDADKDNYINLWNYLHDFAFEPATSVDGRNIYFPTTGTFNNTRTNDIVFREGTVNDVNTKYISVDFSLTNTDENDSAQVYLDNSSTFNIRSDDEDTTGRALRIAFYQNDNKSGDVSSNILQSFSSNPNVVTVYFNDNLGWTKSGNTPKIHIWKSSGGNYTTWPGYEMKHISGDLYYFSFENKNGYNKVLFTDGTGAQGTAANNQTVDLNLINGNIYTPGTKYTSGTNKDKYAATPEAYSSLIDTSGNGYAVIAPGVSTGFQRPYAPVTTINNENGKPTKIVPAYANSIDDYFTVDTDNLFTIAPGETQSLSMIIWLEGTDPNCTEDYYAGDSIDLNLVFSTSTNTALNYTFKLFDETKETWLDDQITKNGLTFNPVMQLYDLDKKRGYLMNLTGKTWSVSAPQDIIRDRLEFRRVNPNDESEIWNYWDASELKPQDIFEYVHDSSDANPLLTVCFTAFADGSPTPDMVSASANVPEHSCGGLWGKHSTTKFTFVDGTNKSGSVRYLIKNDGIMTINYTYHFANGEEQHIEYKASAPEHSGQFFRFIVPTTIVKTISASDNASYNNVNDGAASSTPIYKFKHYTGFDSTYAVNIKERNASIVYKETYTAEQTMDGTCAMTTGDTTYFGVELCYIQGGSNNWSNGERTNMFTDGCTLQVRFYNSSNSEIRKVTLKADSNNSEWGGTDYRGFACVVPANRYKWGVWRTTQDGNTTHNSPNGDQTGYISSHRLYTAQKISNGIIYWSTNSVSWPQYGDY